MKFSTRQDIEAPIDFVFDQVADFDGHARQALRRGIDVERTDTLGCTAPGMRWQVRFSYRGKPRRLDGELTSLDAPNGFLIQAVSGGIVSEFEVELLALSRNRTRLITGLQLTPKSIPARLLIQSLRLSKARLDQRFAQRIAQFASEVEDRHAGNRSPL